LFAFGSVNTKDNKLSGGGSLIYIAPTVSYGLSLKKEKDLTLGINPELSFRYSRVHQEEQKTLITRIAAATRSTFTMAPGIRVSSLLKEKYELSARLGFAFDVYSGGDNAYSVLMTNGISYQLLDQNDRNSKLATELGLNFGYRITPVLRASLGYSGKYASDLLNSTLSLEVRFRF
jgi:hypothetical protein